MKKQVFLAVLAAPLFVSSYAAAEGPWVDRHVTLPARDWSFDVGLGLAHDAPPRVPDYPVGPGFNFEMAVSPIDRLEIGLRSGVRLGDPARETRPDEYARLYDRENFDTGSDIFANPEFHIRGALVRTHIFDLGLEGRAWIPFAPGTRFGTMFGVPMILHLAHIVRLDFGAYIPIEFDDPYVNTWFSFPINVWIQCTERLWLGPEGGFRVHNANDRAPDSHLQVPFGFGLGYQILRNLDLKTQFLFPDLNQDAGAQRFGFGVGIQVRIE